MLSEGEVESRGLSYFKSAVTQFEGYLRRAKESGYKYIDEWMPSYFHIDGIYFGIMTYMHLYAEHQSTGVIIDKPEDFDMTKEASLEALQIAQWMYLQMNAISNTLMFCPDGEPHFEVIGSKAIYRRMYYDEALALKELAIYPHLPQRVKDQIGAAIRGYRDAYEDLQRIEIQAFHQEMKDSPKRGFVYLLQSSTGYYKIGRAKDPSDRLKTFNVKLPFEVDFTCLLKTTDMYALEQELHQRYADKRVNGEWFALDNTDVDHIRELAVQS